MNPAEHGDRNLDALLNAVDASRAQNHGTDSRVLIAFDFADDLSLDEISTIHGIELVSQEAGRVVLAFADEDGLAEFEQRLATLASGAAVSRQALIFAIDAIHQWSASDRTGHALAAEGVPAGEAFTIDVELWPLERRPTRDQIAARF